MPEAPFDGAESRLEEICSICTENLENNVVVTSCTHYFHEACLKPWLDRARTCPLCRKELVQYQDLMDLIDHWIFPSDFASFYSGNTQALYRPTREEPVANPAPHAPTTVDFETLLYPSVLVAPSRFVFRRGLHFASATSPPREEEPFVAMVARPLDVPFPSREETPQVLGHARAAERMRRLQSHQPVEPGPRVIIGNAGTRIIPGDTDNAFIHVPENPPPQRRRSSREHRRNQCRAQPVVRPQAQFRGR